jgi:hypothetical protein
MCLDLPVMLLSATSYFFRVGARRPVAAWTEGDDRPPDTERYPQCILAPASTDKTQGLIHAPPHHSGTAPRASKHRRHMRI